MITIPDFPDYEINDMGDVWSLKGKVRKKLKPSGARYPTVGLRKNNQTHQFMLHRLVAKVFVPNPNNLPNVCHKNDNTRDNRASNLFWGTQKDNMDDMASKGRRSRKGANGEKNIKAKLTEAQIIDIRSRTSTKGLSKEFGVARQTIYSIRARTIWKHIP